MYKLIPLLSLVFMCATTQFSLAQQAPVFSPDDINIPFKKYVLDNGLRLIVHEDHKAPIVAVNIWYHVGSKNEKIGRTGFAHLFEHLMFNGSENFNNDYFQALEAMGATDLNGTTNVDRTNYFQNVPKAGLDRLLFLESDRMGHLLGAIDQARLDEQRGVVQNEKRQGENQPYGRQWELIQTAMFPTGHPYSWTTIGSMEDLDAASLEDVHEWFKKYYGAANAVLSIAGDVDPNEIYTKVNAYFGNIGPGPTLDRPERNIPIRSNDTRASFQDRVPEARVLMSWNTPEFYTKEDAHFDLISSILSSGKNSRLFKRLVYDDQSASNVAAFQWSKEICGNFIIQANVKPGESVEKVENTVNEELIKFLEHGVTEAELQRVKAEYFSNFIKGLERIGGFGGKSDILASSAIYGDSPDAYKKVLQFVADATVHDIKHTANKWLNHGKHTLVCTPFAEYSTTGKDIDRSAGLPELGEPVSASFPDLQKKTLKNGLKIVLAQREGVPTVVMNMMFDAGFASDQFSAPGTAALAMNMMDEGTKKMSSLEINEQLQMLGATLSADSDLDMSYVNMTTLRPTLDASLDLYADVLLNPSFPEADFQRLKNEQLAQIEREKATPIQMALRVVPKLLYSDDHSYCTPLTGSGYTETVAGIERSDILDFYGDWIRPNNATLIVVGDIEMDDLVKKLESRFRSWKKAEVPQKNLSKVSDKPSNKLFLLDRPESQQSVIIGGYLTYPYGEVSEAARETMNNVLGGQFTSRLNMNLREDKHWAYGAGSFIVASKGQRLMLAYAPVQTDKSSESITEIQKEFNAFIGDNPVTQAEFDKTQNNTVMQLPGRWETNGAVAGSVLEIVKFGLADTYYQTFDKDVRNLSLDEIHKLSKKMVKPSQMSWFVVGDKAEILPGLKELGFDEIIEIDADGSAKEQNTVKP
jgi:predicted Zn-dependent peptidase